MRTFKVYYRDKKFTANSAQYNLVLCNRFMQAEDKERVIYKMMELGFHPIKIVEIKPF